MVDITVDADNNKQSLRIMSRFYSIIFIVVKNTQHHCYDVLEDPMWLYNQVTKIEKAANRNAALTRFLKENFEKENILILLGYYSLFVIVPNLNLGN